MKFNEIIIKTNTFGSEFLAGELIVNGITSFSIDDPKDFLEIVEEKSVPFDYYESDLIPENTDVVTVTVYLTQNEQGDARKAFLLEAIKKMKTDTAYGEISVEYSESDDKDWENNWKEFFHPTAIGEKFMIKPSWEDCEPGDRKVLEIDPESSFGSGRHETTKLCLEILEKQKLDDACVLDMGCGSGILGIGACLLGASKCIGVDIEENAVEITRKNAVINHIGDGVLDAYLGNILEDEELVSILNGYKYDVIVSNIVADVLVLMLPIFKSMLKKNGKLILSGIISPRSEQVTNALAANGFKVLDIKQENDWVGIEAEII